MRSRIATVAGERDQLRKAAEAAGIDLDQRKAPAAPEITKEMLVEALTRRPSEKTIKEAVLSVLAGAGHGMTALEILDAINKNLSTNYPRTSLSPQLSRLKAEGKLARDGVVWNLAGKPEGTAGALFTEATPASSGTPEAKGREAGPGGGI